jgi:uncharacterized YigZ family protein
MEWLERARQQYPDARHHCWAYVIGNPENPKLVAMSDDGEPSGTAGKPILNVMQHKEVGDVIAIVVRYFGGVKLGAGGLVRAYSAATQLAYEQITLDTPKNNTVKRLVCEFGDEQRIRHWLAIHEARVIDCSYSKEVTMKVEFESCFVADFSELISALKGGRFTNEE